MSLSAQDQQPPLILPRPGASTTSTPPAGATVGAPTEAALTSTFGSLLPPATHLTTPYGRAAYYVYPPVEPSPSPMRVLAVHGIQTPALGLHPLVAALRLKFPRATIVSFDHWGHGLSDTPIVPHTPALFYELIDLVLDALHWPSAHLIGYSFGGSTVAGYAVSEDRAEKVESLVLVAPAGLLDSSTFPKEAQPSSSADALTAEDERKARDWILDFLEGGKLVVPGDWKDRVSKGEVVAEAVRQWEMEAHPGHLASVVAIFRDAAISDNHAAFRKVADSNVKTLAVLGELDDICSAHQLHEVGIHNVAVVPQVGHAVVRQRVPEVSQHIEEFWQGI